MWETVLSGEKWRGELFNRRKDGSLYQEEMTITPVKNRGGEITHFIAIKLDITDRKQAEEQIRQLALTDPLTGLGNYRRLLDVLDSEMNRCDRTGRSFAVLLLDLDGLKQMNDAHGHLVGSRALGRVADILKLHCRQIDTAARYGGDEFAVILPETEFEAAQHVAKRICHEVRNDGVHPPISVSAGVAIFPQDGKTIDELLAAADRALYRDKRSPKLPLPLAVFPIPYSALAPSPKLQLETNCKCQRRTVSLNSNGVTLKSKNENMTLPEHRVSVRYPLRVPVKLYFSAMDFPGVELSTWTVNISRYGFLLESPIRLVVGSALSVSFGV